MKYRTKFLLFVLAMVCLMPACKKQASTDNKKEGAQVKNSPEWIIFFHERKIYKSSDEKSELLGICPRLQPYELLGSYEHDLRNDMGYKIGNLYKLIKCNGITGWITYGQDIEYGNLDFLQKNLGVIKIGYEFEDEMGGSYGYGEMTVHFNFKTLNVDVNMGLIGINLQYPNFSKTTSKKWTVKNDSSEMILERVGKKIKYTVVSGDQKIKENFDNKVFEFGASSE